jgi:hypothetical protein
MIDASERRARTGHISVFSLPFFVAMGFLAALIGFVYGGMRDGMPVDLFWMMGWWF